MELLGDMVLWNLVLVHLETVLVSVYGLCQMFHRLINHFGTHPMELLGDVGHMESYFGLFGDAIIVDAR
jgi:hypothetical protein